MAAVAPYLNDVLIRRITAMIAAVGRVANSRAAAHVVFAPSVVSHFEVPP